MPGQAVSFLIMTIATALLSGLALFTHSPRVQQVSLEVLFVVSAATSLVIAVRLSLSRLADTATDSAFDETAPLKDNWEPYSGSSMNGDSRGHHRTLTGETKTDRAAAVTSNVRQPPTPATRDSV